MVRPVASSDPKHLRPLTGPAGNGSIRIVPTLELLSNTNCRNGRLTGASNVMAGLGPAIHVFAVCNKENVDGRRRPAMTVAVAVCQSQGRSARVYSRGPSTPRRLFRSACAYFQRFRFGIVVPSETQQTTAKVSIEDFPREAAKSQCLFSQC
jgi:hypothetical protein